MVKSLPAMWETWVLSLGQKDLLDPNLQHQFLLGLNTNASHQTPAPEGEAQLSEFQQPSR